MTSSKKVVFSQIAASKAKIKSFGVEKVGIFGSYVRGEQKPDSDIDLLVNFMPGKKNYRNFLEFSEFAEKLLGLRVEVLTPESLSSYIAPHIIKEVEYVQIS